MTIEGAIAQLQELIDNDGIPFWAKPSLQKVMETVESEREQHIKERNYRNRMRKENKMKTIDEMIAVMTAYKNGKEIECKCKNMPCADWFTIEKPSWDWSCCDYRVKQEPHYVPYDSVLEVERDKWFRQKSDTILRRISQIRLKENEVVFTNCRWNLVELFEKFEYEDGTPCGKKVEE